VLIDHTNRRVLDVLKSRDKPAVLAWLKAGKASGLLAALREVTIDMWGGFEAAAWEVFGRDVRVTIDRFHVMKQFQDRLGDARLEIQRTLPKDQAAALKGSRWLWVTNLENLTPEQRERLAVLQQKFPQLARLSEHREQLRAIFDDPQLKTREAGIRRLQAWCRRGRQLLELRALGPFYKTLEHWMGKIGNYFESRSSNSRTEGFNRGLRTILWRACGMSNFEHFRLRVLHAFG
jgi:transposase